MLSKRTGHESSAFWTLFHVVGVCSSFIVFLLPLRTTVRGVTFGNESVLGCLRVEMGICAVRLRDAFGLWYVHGKCDKLPLLLLRSSMWLWGVWLGRSVAKRVDEVGRSALFEVRLSFGPETRAQAVVYHANGTIQ